MSSSGQILERTEALLEQMRDVHRLKGRDLPQVLQRGRRLLPRGVRKDGAAVAEALKMLGHPRLEKLVNANETNAALDRMSAHLATVDVASIRRGRLMAMAGLLCFNVIAVAVLFVLWMVKTGQL